LPNHLRDVDAQQEIRTARQDESAASDVGKAPEDRANALISAALHRSHAAERLDRFDDEPCKAAEEYAQASDDSARGADLRLETGDRNGAYRARESAAEYAELAAIAAERCADQLIAKARPGMARRYLSIANRCWIRVWHFYDRVRRFWVVRKIKAWEEGSPDSETWRRNEDYARKKAFEGERGAERTRERLQD